VLQHLPQQVAAAVSDQRRRETPHGLERLEHDAAARRSR
jgi:hypothetical protein